MSNKWHPPMAAGANPDDFPKPSTITEEQFKRIAFAAPKNAAAIFVPIINGWAPAYGIDTPEAMAAFLPQLVHESGHFKYNKEIWGPTDQQKRYERDFNKEWHDQLPKGHRNSLAYELGNSQAGDGKYFMGRGAIMTTGRTNYILVSKHLFGDDRLRTNPELLEVPEYSIRAAMYYFTTRVMGKVAITDVTAVTKSINGGLTGIKERRELYNAAKEIIV